MCKIDIKHKEAMHIFEKVIKTKITFFITYIRALFCPFIHIRILSVKRKSFNKHYEFHCNFSRWRYQSSQELIKKFSC